MIFSCRQSAPKIECFLYRVGRRHVFFDPFTPVNLQKKYDQISSSPVSQFFEFWQKLIVFGFSRVHMTAARTISHVHEMVVEVALENFA